ncbi:MarR family winged helix-turn-helix transcriptional regulator [Roseixanthobacter pseudopolyaromaticivorans]|uniref:MarR family winged helix-turn-helix transcriptional regulator n=1 Tax=Xanthobacteraceae TaxID=335928 RepID=UPI00372B21D4
MDQEQLKLGDFLCFAVYSTGHAFNRVYKPILDRLGITYPQYLVMVALWERDGQTVGQIGESLFLESSTLTPLLKRLEAAGHVRRERDSRDERQVRIHLTEQGRALQAQAKDVPSCIFEATGKSIEDLIRLQAEIVSLRAALDRYEGPDAKKA